MATNLNLGKFTRVAFVNDDRTLTREAAAELEIVKRVTDASGAPAAVDVAFTPAGGIAAVNVQAAIEELEVEKADATATATALSGKQPVDSTLSALAGVTTTADQLIYATGVDAFATAPLTAFARTMLDDADAAAVRATIGAGTGSGSGSVTTVSVVSANGFAGTVANPGTTPAITLTTGLTGLLKGNGTAMQVAVAGTDYAVTKADVGLGSVTNDAQTKAAVVPNTAPAAGQVLVGNAGGTAYAPVAMSGDATLGSTGALTLASRRQLANVTLGSAGASLSSGTIAACKYLEVHIFVPAMAGSDTPSLQFNATAGTAYRYKWTFQAAAATAWTAGNTAVSTDRIKIGASDSARGRRAVAFIGNDSSAIEKNVTFSTATGTNSAATQAQVDVGNGAWISAAATQITQIDLISTSNMNAGTQMTVFGWN